MFAVSDDYALDGMLEALVPPCTDAPEQFFSDRPDDLEQAKIVCRVCPLRDMCLAGAIDRREPWGVWGGEVFDRGRIVAHKRGPGRPRKDTLVPAAALVSVPSMRESLEELESALASVSSTAAAPSPSARPARALAESVA